MLIACPLFGILIADPERFEKSPLDDNRQMIAASRDHGRGAGAS
jgi:hypothetical protein